MIYLVILLSLFYFTRFWFVFHTGNIMIEYSYPECTTAVLLGLSTFRKYFPDYRTEEIEATAQKAVRYIKNAQREDGSWFGSWAICFTYAGMFALESLASVGETYENSDNSRRGCDFLISKQEADGGWGESYKSCETGEYHRHSNTQVVNTAWACLALMAAQYPHEEPIRRGIQLVMSRQQKNGEWLQEGIEGVFNKNCMISYPNYKFAFTIYALGRYAKRYGNPKLNRNPPSPHSWRDAHQPFPDLHRPHPPPLATMQKAKVKPPKSLQAARQSMVKAKISTPISFPTRQNPSIAPPKKVIKALYDYDSQGQQELSFSQGDFFHVTGRENDKHWYEACNPATNSRGLVPVTYFQVLEKAQPTLIDAGQPVGPGNKSDSGFADNDELSEKSIDKLTIHFALAPHS
ncbi:terpenoid cyclases/protein prenyltransferase alpha-alpha toroid [Jimgerdemannia flammicorona]|uniref:lanosterol synthase n=1 Tax=Jimgerdemannia flammicorona TaxID=994334 RepID=A0A433QHB1_9FUNG|nr:terpenoid cyclases/protein prenyltransferase alpha-alpha toroid [Jimgerdemannia flammicorona]